MAHKVLIEDDAVDLQKYVPVLDHVTKWVKERSWTSETEELRSLFQAWEAHCSAHNLDPGTCRAFAQRIEKCRDPKLVPFRGKSGRVNYRIYLLRKASEVNA